MLNFSFNSISSYIPLFLHAKTPQIILHHLQDSQKTKMKKRKNIPTSNNTDNYRDVVCMGPIRLDVMQFPHPMRMHKQCHYQAEFGSWFCFECVYVYVCACACLCMLGSVVTGVLLTGKLVM